MVYSKEQRMNLNLVIALRRALHPEEKSLSQTLLDYDMTVSQFGVMDVLYHRSELNVNQIIEKTLSTSGNTTVVIKNLVKLGYVTKRRDPEDGRSFLISITDKGYSLMKEIFPKHLCNISRVFENLNDEEKLNLLNLLKKMNQYGEYNLLNVK